MTNAKHYQIKDLIDKSKKIQVVLFYDESTLWEGFYEKMPEWLKGFTVKMFNPYETYSQIYV